MRPRLSWSVPTSSSADVRLTVLFAESYALYEQESYFFTQSVSNLNEISASYQGPDLLSRQRVWWGLQVDSVNGSHKTLPTWFEIGLLTEEWRGAWIGLPRPYEEHDEHRPCAYLKGEFEITGRVIGARLYVTSAGVHALYINGHRVGDGHFRPGWTDYSKTLYADTHDVGDLLLEGQNAWGAILGDGWYAGAIGFDNRREVYGSSLRLRAQLEVQYASGQMAIFTTDSRWVGRYGPIMASDRHTGECFDARIELGTWSAASARRAVEEGWIPVKEGSGIVTPIVGSCYPWVRVLRELSPILRRKLPNGDLLFDFGVNLSGWIRLKIRARQGQVLRIRYAEILDRSGYLYRENLNGAKSTDTLILQEGENEWQPTFTTHGFRYATITGAFDLQDVVEIQACEVAADVKKSGELSVSHDGLNQLIKAAEQTLRSNFFEVVTDCPQRDERLGWLGDAHGVMFSATCLFDLESFLRKWLQDMRDAQNQQGGFPPFAPEYVQLPEGFRRGWPSLGGEVPGWSDGAVLIPWVAYQQYGNLQILADHYSAMRRWADRSYALSEEGVWRAPSHKILFRDFLELGEHTPQDLVCTAFLARTLEITARAARELGMQRDEAELIERVRVCKEAFAREFLTADGRLSGNSQGAYALALAFDLVPPSAQSAVLKNLLARLKAIGRPSTGALTTRYLLPALSVGGRSELAWDLLLREDFPSWLWWMRCGLTTLPEHWDAIGPDGDILDTPGNSFNHFTFSSYVEWLVAYGMGLQPLEPGWKRLRIAPKPTSRISQFGTRLRLPRGVLESSWTIAGDRTVLDFLVPPGSSAEVVVGPDPVEFPPGRHRLEFETSSLSTTASTWLVC